MLFMLAVLGVVTRNTWPRIEAATGWKILAWITPFISIVFFAWKAEYLDYVSWLVIGIIVSLANIIAAHAARVWSRHQRWYWILLLLSFLAGIVWVGMVMVVLKYPAAW